MDLTLSRRVRKVLHDQLPTAALAALLVVSACGGGQDEDGDGTELPSPLAGCDGFDSPPPAAKSGAFTAAPPDADALPALELACFSGGEPFDLADLRGPAVVNLWASWCPPCREELPALQRYADAYAEQVHVIGVVTADEREAAVALASDLGITFPALDDPKTRLVSRLGGALPITLFVDDAGQIRYVHYGQLDEAALAAYVTEYLAEP